MGDGRPIALGRLLRSGRSRRSQDNALWHLSGRHQRPKRDEQLARGGGFGLPGVVGQQRSRLGAQAAQLETLDRKSVV